jgi:predicted RNA binding protein YcfA (HicA-like mRNA interferase family)
MIRALERAGFVVIRTSGSHHRMVHRDDPSRQTTVPLHGNRRPARGTLRDNIDQAGLTVEEFVDLLG